MPVNFLTWLKSKWCPYELMRLMRHWIYLTQSPGIYDDHSSENACFSVCLCVVYINTAAIAWFSYIYTHTHTHTHTHTQTYIHTHTYIYTYIHTHIHTYIHTYIHTHIHTHTYINTYIIHTYTYIQT